MRTKEKLVQALEQAGAPVEMIEKAKAGLYDDFETKLEYPISALVEDANAAGLTDIAELAMRGEFVSPIEEGLILLREALEKAGLPGKGLFDGLAGEDMHQEEG